jgi:hypothetical protein
MEAKEGWRRDNGRIRAQPAVQITEQLLNRIAQNSTGQERTGHKERPRVSPGGVGMVSQSCSSLHPTAGYFPSI